MYNYSKFTVSRRINDQYSRNPSCLQARSSSKRSNSAKKVKFIVFTTEGRRSVCGNFVSAFRVAEKAKRTSIYIIFKRNYIDVTRSTSLNRSSNYACTLRISNKFQIIMKTNNVKIAMEEVISNRGWCNIVPWTSRPTYGIKYRYLKFYPGFNSEY